MDGFAWQESYSISVPEIDDQHKNLFAIGDTLYRAAFARETHRNLSELLDRLLVSSQQHFATEERLMASSAFPDYAQHKQAARPLRRESRLLTPGIRDRRSRPD